MNAKLKRKSFILYGIAIASVIALFKVVTVYGEANLKARPNINGQYRLVGVSIPGCSLQKNLWLIIQQSGVYLNGNLSNSESKSDSALKEKLPLKGKYEDQEFHLSGFLPVKQICERSLSIASRNDELLTDIQAGFVDMSLPNNAAIPLAGQLSIDKITNKIDFTAEPYSTDSKAATHSKN